MDGGGEPQLLEPQNASQKNRVNVLIHYYEEHGLIKGGWEKHQPLVGSVEEWNTISNTEKLVLFP